MNKLEIKELLNKPQMNITVVTREIIKYISESPLKEEIINHIVTRAKETKGFTTIDLFKFFFEKTEDLVKGTKHCGSLYATQILLKTVWEQSHLSTTVINNIRQQYKLYVIEPSKPLTREEQLVIQAQRMRDGKARKAAEQKAKKIAAQKTKITYNTNVEPAKPEASESKFTKEQLAQIEFLRGLHN